MHVAEMKTAKVTFESEGHKIIIDAVWDEEGLHLSPTAENPANLKEHHGLHVALANKLYEIFDLTE